MVHSNFTAIENILPQPLIALYRLLQGDLQGGPSSFATFDIPANRGGFWWMDFSTKPGRVIVRWNEETAFGIDLYNPSDLDGLGYGENPQHTAQTPEEARDLINKLITEQILQSTVSDSGLD